MSEEEDHWDLSLQIEGLSLRLRGLRLGSRANSSRADPPSPSDSLASFALVGAPLEQPATLAPTRVHSAAGPSTGSAASPNPLQASATGEVRQVHPGARSLQSSSSSSAAAVPEYPLPQRSPPSAFGTRQAIALDFPALPDSCLALCSSLSGSELSGVERASRAWLAGCWASAVLAGKVDKPDPSPASVPRAWLRPLLCLPLLPSGAWLATTHGFPSVAECRVYFSGAQVPYPASLTR